MNSNNLVVKNSKLHGKGLFTVSDFKSGEIITTIKGELIDSKECIRRELEESNVYIFYKDEDEYIDASNQPDIKYLNHSCQYNCDIYESEDGRLLLYAVTYIPNNSELTIDYGYDEIYESCCCKECI